MPEDEPPHPAAARTLAGGGTPACDLRILATTDMHVNLRPHDYYTDRPQPGGCLARAATMIAGLRGAAANSLLLDNGDFLQGSPLGDHAAATGGPHPAIMAMNAMGYDAGTIGNHDLDYGVEFLRAALADAAFPVVSGNLQTADGAATLFAPMALLDRHVTDRTGAVWPLRIAVLGFLPPQTMIWGAAHLDGHARVPGIVETARRQLPVARAAKADLVVALCHSGTGDGTDDPMSEDAALALAALPGIDAVIAGHSHLVFPGPWFAPGGGFDPAAGRLAGTPAVMPGYGGNQIGVIDLVLHRRHDRPGWQAMGGTGRVLAVTTQPDGSPLAPDNRVMRVTASAHVATRAGLRRIVGHSATALHSHFSLARDCGATRLVARAQAWHIRRALTGTAHDGLPVLSASAPFRAGGRFGPDSYSDLGPGPLRLRHLADICPYPNTVSALHLTGAMLAEWLEHAAGIFHSLRPGVADQPLIRPDGASYNFDLIEGLTYSIDLTAPARYGLNGVLQDPGARRIRDLRHNGQPLDPDARFVLACNSYRASGGGSFPFAGPEHRIHTGRDTVRAALVAYLAETGRFRPPDSPVWRFAPIAGTSALLDTGPGAAAYLPAPGLERAGGDGEGFLRLRVRFDPPAPPNGPGLR